jgi:hypothetical protein
MRTPLSYQSASFFCFQRNFGRHGPYPLEVSQLAYWVQLLLLKRS